MGFHVREISSDIGNGQSVWKPLPINYGDGGSIQSEGVIDKVCTLGSHVASFTLTVEENPGSCAGGPKRELE